MVESTIVMMIMLVDVMMIMIHDRHDHLHNYDDHTCCQVPSHVSDACPGARVVASLYTWQLFTLGQSAMHVMMMMMMVVMIMMVILMMVHVLLPPSIRGNFSHSGNLQCM